MADSLLLADGVSHLLLEGGGLFLLEDAAPDPDPEPDTGAVYGITFVNGQPRLVQVRPL